MEALRWWLVAADAASREKWEKFIDPWVGPVTLRGPQGPMWLSPYGGRKLLLWLSPYGDRKPEAQGDLVQSVAMKTLTIRCSIYIGPYFWLGWAPSTDTRMVQWLIGKSVVELSFDSSWNDVHSLTPMQRRRLLLAANGGLITTMASR